jgi:hypothetical protein
VSASVLEPSELLLAAPQTGRCETLRSPQKSSRWRPENFAREQIRRLVRQLFFSNSTHPVRQVVFCAAESGTDVQSICLQAAQELALDTSGSVAILSRAVGSDQPALTANAQQQENETIDDPNSALLRRCAMRIRRNLWLVPQARLAEKGGGFEFSSRLNELRREFEYSIIQGPAVAESSEAAALGQSADGVVLVLAAHVTRRALALKIKEMLEAAQVRLLGTVLSERRFPIPEAIYRSL